jgi:hypothetical protein
LIAAGAAGFTEQVIGEIDLVDSVLYLEQSDHLFAIGWANESGAVIWTGSALNIENQLIELGQKKEWKWRKNETTKIVTELSRCSGV